MMRPLVSAELVAGGLPNRAGFDAIPEGYFRLPATSGPLSRSLS